MKNIKIAIIGRSNTGKSTLFNKLAHLKKNETSIVYNEHETTRDLRYATIKLLNIPCKIIDTPGLTSKPKSFLSLNLQKYTDNLIKKSHLLLFVTDILETNYHEDFLILERIKKFERKIILIVNKCDNFELENLANLWCYDFKIFPIIKISAKKALNLNLIKELSYEYIIKNPPRLETRSLQSSKKIKLISIALIGKPNVGKSSLLNALLKKERSQVAPEPGTTRDPVQAVKIWKHYKILFLDTAGIRRKNKIDQDIEKYSVQKSIRSIEKAQLSALLIDLSVEFSHQEKKILNLLKDRKKIYLIIFTKIDQMDASEFKQKKKEFFKNYPFIPKDKSIATSALKNQGLVLFLNAIIQNFIKTKQIIQKSKIKEFLNIINDKYFLQRKRNFHIKDIKIKSQNPMNLQIVVNKKIKIPKDYKAYLKNQLKMKFKKISDINVSFISKAFI